LVYSQVIELLVNGLEIMWKEAVVKKIDLMLRNFVECLRKTSTDLKYCGWYAGQIWMHSLSIMKHCGPLRWYTLLLSDA